MWNWIARETIERKRKVEEIEYFVRKKKRPINRSFCCEYISRCDDDCYCCPINWQSPDNAPVHCMRGLYGRWVQEDNDYLLIARYAQEIATAIERKE